MGTCHCWSLVEAVVPPSAAVAGPGLTGTSGAGGSGGGSGGTNGTGGGIGQYGGGGGGGYLTGGGAADALSGHPGSSFLKRRLWRSRWWLELYGGSGVTAGVVVAATVVVAVALTAAQLPVVVAAARTTQLKCNSYHRRGFGHCQSRRFTKWRDYHHRHLPIRHAQLSGHQWGAGAGLGAGNAAIGGHGQ